MDLREKNGPIVETARPPGDPAEIISRAAQARPASTSAQIVNGHDTANGKLAEAPATHRKTVLETPHPYPGRLIAVEGIDGSGKSTQLLLLERWLRSRGYPVHYTEWNWESGMHLALGTDLFDSFERYQGRLLEEYRKLSSDFAFTTIDARPPIDDVQTELRKRIADHLHVAAERPVNVGSGSGPTVSKD
jgi:Thymidylate kinase